MKALAIALGFVAIGTSFAGLLRLSRRNTPPTTAELTALVINTFAFAVGTAAILVVAVSS